MSGWPAAIVVQVFDLVELTEQARKAAGIDMTLATGVEALAAVVAFGEIRCLIDAADAHALARVDALGVADTEFGLSTGTWLARQRKEPPAAAKARVRVSKQLVMLNAVDEALMAGEISWEHVKVIAAAVANPRVGNQIAELQDEILALARNTLFEQWRNDIHSLVALLDQDGPDPDDLDRNTLSANDTIDGTTHLRGSFTHANGLVVRNAIDTIADQLFHQFSERHAQCPDIEIPNRATLRALALVELCERGLAVDLTSSRPPKPSVSLVLRPDDPDHITTLDGRRVQGNRLSTLLCDPEFTAIVINSLGVPIDLGHTVRFATAAQRKAVAIRDGGCVFPGCDKPISWLNMHHVEPYDHGRGGPTDLLNLAGLCGSEHGVSHRKGWRMWATHDSWFIWESPTGQKFWSQRHHRQREGPIPERE